MAALVVPGAPVSALIEHGLTEKIVEKLTEAGIGTVEKLGSMTPEQLEEIPGIGPKLVERIQIAVNGYYLQFEEVLGGTRRRRGRARGAPGAGGCSRRGRRGAMSGRRAGPRRGRRSRAGNGISGSSADRDSAESAGESDTIKDSD